MKDSALEAVRLMPRDELESFAVRAALQLRSDRGEIEAANVFLAVLIGFCSARSLRRQAFSSALGWREAASAGMTWPTKGSSRNWCAMSMP